MDSRTRKEPRRNDARLLGWLDLTRGARGRGRGVAVARLPDQIPTHWNIRNEVDGYGGKWTLFVMPVMMVGMLVLFYFLPALSPKAFSVDSFRSTYLYIMLLVVGLFAYMQGVLLYTVQQSVAKGHAVPLGQIFIAGMFLFFGLMGNVMGKVRKNFYIGIRVPWTLASDRVWNDTHRMAGWLWVVAGFVGFGLVILACRSTSRSSCWSSPAFVPDRVFVHSLQGAREAGGVVSAIGGQDGHRPRRSSARSGRGTACSLPCGAWAMRRPARKPLWASLSVDRGDVAIEPHLRRGRRAAAAFTPPNCSRPGRSMVAGHSSGFRSLGMPESSMTVRDKPSSIGRATRAW